MGSKEIRSLICIISWMGLMFYCPKADPNLYEKKRNSLDFYIHESALNRTGRIISGILYDIPLPYNFSGLSASFVRIRSSRLWLTGANYSVFHISPRTLPHPFSKRIRIVYENLGNWSSSYYNVPSYTFITPVVGFIAYDATKNDSVMVEIRPTKDPILIRFPNLSLPGGMNIKDVQCVQFKTNGEVEFSEVTLAFSCIAHDPGHFTLAIQSLPIPIPSKKSSKIRVWKWWVIGFGVGFFAFFLLILLGLFFYKCVTKKRITRMEKESEISEALESIWVGRSRMPQANSIRTQPTTVENNYVP